MECSGPEFAGLGVYVAGLKQTKLKGSVIEGANRVVHMLRAFNKILGKWYDGFLDVGL